MGEKILLVFCFKLIIYYLCKKKITLDELETHPTTGTGQVEPLKGYVEVLSAYGHYE